MVDGNDVKRKPGAVTVLALLVSFLFAAAPPAQAGPVGRAQLGSAEQVKQAPPLRTSIRSQDDRDADSVLLPPAPTIVTEALCARPAAAPCRTGWSSGPRTRLTAYRARAPPAV